MGANAQTAVPTFTIGQVLTAAQQNQINTGIPVFATTTTRDAAFGGSGEKTLDEGQYAYVEADDTLYRYTGAAWVKSMTTYTDVGSTLTFDNFTKGNATIVARIIEINKLVHFYGKIDLGSTSSVSSPVNIVLPITASDGLYYHPTLAFFVDASPGATYFGTNLLVSTTQMRFQVMRADGTYAKTEDISAAVPMTWASGDSLVWNFLYRAA